MMSNIPADVVTIWQGVNLSNLFVVVEMQDDECLVEGKLEDFGEVHVVDYLRFLDRRLDYWRSLFCFSLIVASVDVGIVNHKQLVLDYIFEGIVVDAD